MVVWPAVLNDSQFLPITMVPVDERLVTGMDDGSVKVRARSSRYIERYTMTTYWNGDQLSTFRLFYRHDLAGGTLPFDWESPVSDAVLTMRFQPRQNPPWSFFMVHSSLTPGARLWEGTLHLELA